MVWSGRHIETIQMIGYHTIVMIEKITHYATHSSFKLTYYGKMEF